MKLLALIYTQVVPVEPIWATKLSEFISNSSEISLGLVFIVFLGNLSKIITSFCNGKNELNKTKNDHEYRMFITNSQASEKDLIQFSKNIDAGKIHDIKPNRDEAA